MRLHASALGVLLLAASSTGGVLGDLSIQGRGDVLAPVVLDGKRFEPAEFNALRIAAPLHSAFDRNGQVLHLFRTTREVRAFIEEQSRLPTAATSGGRRTRPVASHGCLYHVGSQEDAYWIENTFCGGLYYTTHPGNNVSNLALFGWNDRFSSMKCTIDTTYTPACVMYDGFSFTGSSHWVYSGASAYVDDLSVVGLDNRISSIIQYTNQ